MPSDTSPSRNASAAVSGGLAVAREGDAGPVPQILVAASGAARCGTTLSAAILAVTASALGRDVLLVDTCPGGTVLPLLGAPTATNFAAIGPTLRAAAAGVAALVPLLEATTISGSDAVLVDAGSRLGNVLGALAAARAAGRSPGLLVITGTDAAQLAAAYALIKVAAERGLTDATEVVIVGGDEQEAHDAFVLLTAGVRRFLDRPLLLAAHVPEDPSLAVALAAGMSVHDAAAGSPAAAALAPLAARWAASAPTPIAVPAIPAVSRPGTPPPRRPAVPGLSGSLAFAAAPAR